MRRTGLREVAAVGGSVGFAAVMLTIGLGLGRTWVQLDPRVFGDTFLPTFLFLLPCIAVTLTPALVGVIGARRATGLNTRSRRLWSITLGGLAFAVVVTLAYHVPANIRIASGDLSAEELTSELRSWLAWHAVRTTAGLAAAAAAIMAIVGARTTTDPQSVRATRSSTAISGST